MPPEQLPLALWLESDRMGWLREVVRDDEVAREREIVADEYRDKLVDDAGNAFVVLGRQEVFPPWHPYHATGTGDEGTLGALAAGDVRAFLRTWYSPSNATLAVAGRFDATLVIDLVTKYFAPIPTSDVPARPPTPTWKTGDARVDVAMPFVHPQVAILWPTPALDARGDAELDMVSTLLTGLGGRLRHHLVDAGLALSVSSGQESLRRDSLFKVSAVVAPGVAPDDVLDAMEKVHRRAYASDRRGGARGRARSMALDDDRATRDVERPRATPRGRHGARRANLAAEWYASYDYAAIPRLRSARGLPTIGAPWSWRTRKRDRRRAAK